jgi:hypothetical protein
MHFAPFDEELHLLNVVRQPMSNGIHDVFFSLLGSMMRKVHDSSHVSWQDLR